MQTTALTLTLALTEMRATTLTLARTEMKTRLQLEKPMSRAVHMPMGSTW